MNSELKKLLNEDDAETSQDKGIFNMTTIYLRYVQNENIAVFSVCSKFLMFSNKKNEIFRYIFNDEESLQQALIMPNIERFQIIKIFSDFKGNHSIICLQFLQTRINYHLNHKTTKFKECIKLKEVSIETIAWDDNSSEFTTNQILIGTETGNLISYQLDYDTKKDQILEKMTIVINLKQRIAGIAMETVFIKTNEPRRYIMVTTQTHLYQFIGPHNYEILFKNYLREPKYLDNSYNIFPVGDVDNPQLQLIYVKDKLHSFGWMSGVGYCMGEFSNDPFKIIIKKFKIVPYAKLGRELNSMVTTETPHAAAHSEHHIFLLFSDCISVISKITYNIVHTEAIIKGNITNMYYDKSKNCLWLNSNTNIYQMTITNEASDIWKAYLEKEEYDLALDFCENRKREYVKKVARLYANSNFEKQNYHEAALLYVKSDEYLEEVALKFLKSNQDEALNSYVERIEAKLSTEDFTQRCLLDIWQVEMCLEEINRAIDKNKPTDKLLNLLKKKEKYLDKSTVYQLLQQSGRLEEFLFFAEVKKDYETIIIHHINNKDIAGAIKLLKKYGNEVESKKQDLYNIFTRFSNIFMLFEPENTIDTLLDHYKSYIDPNKIIFAIMNTDQKKRDKIVIYLDKMIKNSTCSDKNFHNLYIFFLCQSSNDNKASCEILLNYLQEAFENKSPSFDVDYALKVFSQFKVFSAQSYSLAIMEKYDEAIKIALQNDHLDVAKIITKNIEDLKVKKRLWLEIFTYIIRNNQQNINYSIDIMNESDILKIEDVLPHIMDNIKIESFKEKLDECIKKYEEDNTNIKHEIISYNTTAENIKADIMRVKKKQMEINYQDCVCEICNSTIKDENILIFPCRHIFDENCIVETLKKYNLNMMTLSEKMEKIYILKGEISALEKKKESIEEEKKEKDNKGFLSGFLGARSSIVKREVKELTKDECHKLETFKKQYYDLLTEDCICCGDLIIQNIRFKFDVDDYDKNSWMIF